MFGVEDEYYEEVQELKRKNKQLQYHCDMYSELFEMVVELYPDVAENVISNRNKKGYDDLFSDEPIVV